MKHLKQHYLPIILIILGVIDQSTDLLVQFLHEVNAPIWCGTLLRIIVVSFGGFKLYITNSNKLNKDVS